MPDFSDRDYQDRLQSYLNIHLKKDKQSYSVPDQIEELQKKDRNKWIQLAVNVAAILFFGYSFYYNITQLSETFLIIILAVFVINVGLIFYQKKQIQELINFLTWKRKHES